MNYISDKDLKYDTYRYTFRSAECLKFDENYRLAQLPLVAPDHQLSIHRREGFDYEGGRYEVPRYSLVVPVSVADLQRSPAFAAMIKDMAESSFSTKVAWNICAARAEKLHFTLAAGFSPDELEDVAARSHSAFAQIGSFHVKLRGPYIGNKNTGRIYLPAYPQVIGEDDPLGLLQDAISRPRSKFYAMGYFNLLDELSPDETDELASLIASWANVALAEIRVDELALLETHDDLVLASRRIADIHAAHQGASLQRKVP